jgi:dTDP-glucose 4,6-dehydratase
VNTAKLQGLGWEPDYTFEMSLNATVDWYVNNEGWWRPIKTGDYLEYYKRNYGNRAALI